MTRVWSPEPTGWKKWTDLHKLSSDFRFLKDFKHLILPTSFYFLSFSINFNHALSPPISPTYPTSFSSSNKKQAHINTEFVLFWPIILQPEACPGEWLIYPVSLHWRKPISLSQELSITNSFLFEGVGFCAHFAVSMWGVWFGFCAGFVHAAILSLSSYCINPIVSGKKCHFLDGVHHPWLLESFYPSHLHRSLHLEGKSVIKIIYG